MSFPLSTYRKAGDIVFVSGQIGIKGAELVGGGIVEETRQAVENISGILSDIGLSLNHVVSVDVFLSCFDEDYSSMNDIYRELFNQPYPSRTCVGVKDLPRGARIEIKVTALIN